jgi:hypothetical protein
MKELLSGVGGEKIAVLSRLGTLEKYLAKAQDCFQVRLTEAQANVKGWEKREAAVLVAQQVKLRQNLLEDQLSLSTFRSKLGQFGETFVTDCIKNTQHLMDVDQNWTKKLKNSFELSFNAYKKAVDQGVQAAMAHTKMNLTSFNLSLVTTNVEISAADDPSAMIGAAVGVVSTLGMDGGLISGAIGAAVGSWVGKNFFGTDVKKKTLETVEQVARTQLPSLRIEAENYIDGVTKQLIEFEQSNQPKIQPSSILITAQQVEQYYSDLVHWCRSFQDEINQIKKEITK